jgi:amino acid transporter
MLAMCLAGLVLITAVNLWGIAESARVLMLPMVLFLAAIFGVIAVGLMRSHRPRWSAARSRSVSAKHSQRS